MPRPPLKNNRYIEFLKHSHNQTIWYLWDDFTQSSLIIVQTRRKTFKLKMTNFLYFFCLLQRSRAWSLDLRQRAAAKREMEANYKVWLIGLWVSQISMSPTLFQIQWPLAGPLYKFLGLFKL